MRTNARTLIKVISTCLVASAAIACANATAASPVERPNFVVIQTDDQAFSDLWAEFRSADGVRSPVMPATVNKIVRRGVTFNNHYVTFPTCCPSRVSLITGQYNHNNGVLGNVAPDGGWQAFRRSHGYHANLATWLQSNGYRTIHIGKFLNQYGNQERPETTVPPGWNEWQTTATDYSNRMFYGYLINENGSLTGPFGSEEYGLWQNVDRPGCLRGFPIIPGCDHQTDAVTRRAVDQIASSAAGQRPFYLQVDYIAPHGDHRPPIGPEPTPRNYGRADHTPLPRDRAFNEADIRDKPSFIRNGPGRISRREINRMRTEYRRTLESLRDVDDGVRRILQALWVHGVLRDTYVFFTSDNGFFRGQHRLARGKILAYEPSAKIPLAVRGPGIRPGIETGELSANIDLAPTILKLAGVRPTRTVDGRSLVRFWKNPERRTLRPILIESFAEESDLKVADRQSRWSAGGFLPYRAIRLSDYKFVLYGNGERELYDLFLDPNELHNRARAARYRKLARFLQTQINRYANCAGVRCRRPADPPPIPGVPASRLRWGH